MLLTELPSFSPPTGQPATDDWSTAANHLHEELKSSHVNMPILSGTLLLYLAGRFENFVKVVFEDLCDSLVAGCSDFGNLPKTMQENLVTFTAEVIKSPRKYGHAENGVIAFVSTLADNLNRKPLSGVNSKCLSITSENMWPETITEIFKRIGVKNIWDRLGQQAVLQSFLHEADQQKATSEAKILLSEIMDLRNKIAHPSGALSWPAIDNTQHYIEFCEALSTAISDVCTVLATALPNRTSGSS